MESPLSSASRFRGFSSHTPSRISRSSRLNGASSSVESVVPISMGGESYHDPTAIPLHFPTWPSMYSGRMENGNEIYRLYIFFTRSIKHSMAYADGDWSSCS
ncbi:hypothetical protein Tco_1064142 [Tanacetum coccineum]